TLSVVFSDIKAQPPIESQCNPNDCKRVGCSINTDCECLSLTNGGGMCADALVQCSILTPCENDNQTCRAPNTICIQHSRCNSLKPLCYPIALASLQVCPPYCLDSDLITFDNILNVTDTSNGFVIPNGYSGLNWNQAMALNKSSANPQLNTSGYFNALKSGQFIAYNGNGNPMTISSRDNNIFNISSFVGSAAWVNDLAVTIIGRRLSTPIYSTTIILHKNMSKLIELNWIDLDNITFSTYGSDGQQFAMDNLCLTTT
ncbi:unnamed protein product, partial [Didymodactylos carnosus]